MFQKSIHGQFVNNSWTFMFQKTALSPLPLPSSPFLSLPLLVSLSFCLFVFLSFCLFVSLSLPLFSSLVLSLVLSRPLFLSFFNVRPANPANALKTKELKKRHFWLKFLSQGKPLIIKMLGTKFAHYFLTSPPTLHSTRRRNRPQILRRETLHYVGFHVGFAGPILHT